MNSANDRWPSFLIVLGGAGFILAYLAAGSADWGPPGTGAYEQYQLLNRLVAVPLLLLVVGVFALGIGRRDRMTWLEWAGWGVTLAGAVLLLVGSVAEFWILTMRTYADSGRIWAWTTFLIGGFLLIAGAILWTVTAFRARTDAATA